MNLRSLLSSIAAPLLVVPITVTILGVAFAMSLAGCPTPQPVQPVADADAAPAPPPDAWSPPPVTVVPDAQAPGLQQCEAACAVLAAHGCPSARVADGGACVPVCVSTIGSAFNVNPGCISECTVASTALTCIRGCGDPCQGGR